MKGLTGSVTNAIHGKPANYRGHSTTSLGRRRKRSKSVRKAG